MKNEYIGIFDYRKIEDVSKGDLIVTISEECFIVTDVVKDGNDIKHHISPVKYSNDTYHIDLFVSYVLVNGFHETKNKYSYWYTKIKDFETIRNSKDSKKTITKLIDEELRIRLNRLSIRKILTITHGFPIYVEFYNGRRFYSTGYNNQMDVVFKEYTKQEIECVCVYNLYSNKMFMLDGECNNHRLNRIKHIIGSRYYGEDGLYATRIFPFGHIESGIVKYNYTENNRPNKLDVFLKSKLGIK